MRRPSFFISAIPHLYIQQRHYIHSADNSLYLAAINGHDMDLAEQIFAAGQRSLQQQKKSTKSSTIIYAKPDLCENFSYSFPIPGSSKPYSDELVNVLRDAAQQSMALLKNVPLCIALLKNLDSQIAKYANVANCDFSKITPGRLIQFNEHYALPAQPVRTLRAKKSVENLHLFIMNEQLKKEGINTQDEQYRFLGFVDRTHANTIIRSGALFSEEVAMGSLLVHGADTHYFHWYLLSMAVEKGYLKFKKNLPLRNLLTASVDFRCVITDSSMWDRLIDFSAYAFEPSQSHACFGLRSPFYLTEFLLSNPAIPHVRGFMLNQWYENIERIQSLYASKYKTAPISYHLLVAAHAASKNNASAITHFNETDLFSFSPTMKKKLVDTAMPGVYYENKDRLFKNVKKLDQKLSSPEKKSNKTSFFNGNPRLFSKVKNSNAGAQIVPSQHRHNCF